MSETSEPAVSQLMLVGRRSAAAFFVVLREPISASWIEYLSDVQLVGAPGEAVLQSPVLAGTVKDFAAFMGLLGKLQNLGLTVLSISYQELSPTV